MSKQIEQLTNTFTDECVLAIKIKNKQSISHIFEILRTLTDTCMLKFSLNDEKKQKGKLKIYKNTDSKCLIKCELKVKYLKFDSNHIFKIGETLVAPICERLNVLTNDPLLIKIRYDQQNFHLSIDNIS
ncbi:putative orfan [Tupanvirus soda lake]|uniref:Orfan n=2 Tax=Tupanvirus TaxID=2094720 RepID=A0AC62ABD0_9VIRU|nr:putative orfan [Tupanvirus soda lake]QKU35049.1 putative orfan [Tupanvirus soda lake]